MDFAYFKQVLPILISVLLVSARSNPLPGGVYSAGPRPPSQCKKCKAKDSIALSAQKGSLVMSPKEETAGCIRSCGCCSRDPRHTPKKMCACLSGCGWQWAAGSGILAGVLPTDPPRLAERFGRMIGRCRQASANPNADK